MDNEGTIRVGIYDKGGGRFEQNALAGAIAVCEPTSVTVLNVSSRKAVDRLRQFTHIVCHLNGDMDQAGLSGPSWPTLIAGDLSTAHVIIRVSSQGAGGMSDSFRPPYRHDKGPWILHLIEPSGSVTIDQWKKIFLAIKALDTTQPELPETVRAIFDAGSERQALRLLCEAWLFAEGQASKPHGSITIHAPTKPDDWFSLFGKTCTTDAAENIAGKMGKAEDVAVKLLRRLANEQSGSVTWESYRDDVARLEAALGP
jgi:hypothetical protein